MIQAGLDTKRTGGIFENHVHGVVCTVFASVAKFTRAVRNWNQDFISTCILYLAFFVWCLGAACEYGKKGWR